MAKFTVKATAGKRKVEFNSNATTFGELKTDFAANDVSYNEDMQVIVQSTKSALLTNDSPIPAGDQTIYLMPKKTKSGAWAPDGFDGDDIEDAETEDLIARKEEIATEVAAITAELERRLFNKNSSADTRYVEEEEEEEFLSEEEEDWLSNL